MQCSSSVTLVVKIDNKDQYLDSESTIYRIHYILYQPITNNVKSLYQESHLKYTSSVGLYFFYENFRLILLNLFDKFSVL